MLHDVKLTPRQAVALGNYAEASPDETPLLVQRQPDGSMLVGQGDERVLVETSGELIRLDLRGEPA